MRFLPHPLLLGFHFESESFRSGAGNLFLFARQQEIILFVCDLETFFEERS